MMLGNELFIRRELRKDLTLDLDSPEASLRDSDLRKLVQDRFAEPGASASQPPAAIVAAIVVVGVVGFGKWRKDSTDSKNDKDNKDTVDRALKNNKDTSDAAIKLSKDTQDKQSQDQKDASDTVDQDGDGDATGGHSWEPYVRRSLFEAPRGRRRQGSFTALLDRLAA